jgi:[ribosomal protein S5]-alanine N-acetyltransferase
MISEMVVTEIPVLRTSRLVLRPLAPRDAHPLFDLYSSPRVMAHNIFPPFTRFYEAEDLLKYHALLFESQRGLRWAMAQPDSGSLIGTCGYHNWHTGRGEAELSYELSPDYWCQGLMSEALSPVLEFGWKKMNLTSIRARVLPGNQGSIHLLQKFGFAALSAAEVKEPRLQNGREVHWYALSAPVAPTLTRP